MRISAARIEELKLLLKQHYGLDYDDEQAQQAGRAILKFVGLKLYRQISMDKLQNGYKNGRPQRSPKTDR